MLAAPGSRLGLDPPPRRRGIRADPARRRAARHDRRPLPRPPRDRRPRRPRLATPMGATAGRHARHRDHGRRRAGPERRAKRIARRPRRPRGRRDHRPRPTPNRRIRPHRLAARQPSRPGGSPNSSPTAAADMHRGEISSMKAGAHTAAGPTSTSRHEPKRIAPARDVMSPREVANRAGFSYHAILRAIHRGDLQAFEPVPGQYRIELEGIRTLAAHARSRECPHPRSASDLQTIARAERYRQPHRSWQLRTPDSDRRKSLMELPQAQRQVATALARGRP